MWHILTLSLLHFTVRERRQRLREQGVLNGSPDDSVEDLSIDASVGSHSELDRASGIGRVSYCFCLCTFMLCLHCGCYGARLRFLLMSSLLYLFPVLPYGRVNN